MPTQIEKVQAHASRMLDKYIELRERYALLEPMLFNESVVNEWGTGSQARGFNILKHSLFLSCSQDIAKLILDEDQRTPSMINLVRVLGNEKFRNELKMMFSDWAAPSLKEETDPATVEALCRLEARERAERMEQFENLYCEAMTLWEKLSADSAVKGFRTIRDKVSSHTEVYFNVDKYQFVDIGTLGIKWGDLRSTIAEMQRLVEILGLLIRGSCFAWDELDNLLVRASHGFWKTREQA